MKPDKINLKRQLIAAVILLMLVACAKPYHFFVKYDLPESSSQLEGQKVYLQVSDARASKDFLSEKARNEFELWDDRFALYHTPKKPKGQIETYSLDGLIETAMKMRLENMGITVIEEKTDDIPFFEVILQKFSLKLNDRTWVSNFSYEVKLSIDAMESAGIAVDELRAFGGGAKSPLWLQAKADIYGKPVRAMDVSEAPALGVALHAGVATGVFSSIEDGVTRMVRVGRTYEPNMVLHEQYMESFAAFKQVYPALMALNHQL